MHKQETAKVIPSKDEIINLKKKRDKQIKSNKIVKK